MTEFIILLSIVFLMIISQAIISFTYSRYSREEASLPITGKETVENMLNRNCIIDVRLGYTTGTLNDHYNSNRKTINLSKMFAARRIMFRWPMVTGSKLPG